MGKGFLIDTNVVIDFLNYSLPEAGILLLSVEEPALSIINYIELLSKQEGSESEIKNRRICEGSSYLLC